MKKSKILLLSLLAALTVAAFSGCSDTPSSSSGSDAIIATQPSGNNNQSADPNEKIKNEGHAQVEITANADGEANTEKTSFRLNRIIDSGKTTDDGDPYIFLDVTISNKSSDSYDLSIINNFYILLPDNSEIHFDIRTQLYATQNVENYFASPFNVPADGEFSGVVGGFILPKDTQDFKVCFFPTEADASNKTNVIKVDSSAQNMEKVN